MKTDGPSSVSVYLNAGKDGVKLGQPFNLDVVVCSDLEGQDSISIERLDLDATMPVHQHGMNYTTEISQV